MTVTAFSSSFISQLQDRRVERLVYALRPRTSAWLLTVSCVHVSAGEVTAVYSSCFYQLRQLKSVKSSLTGEGPILLYRLVHCRLDYCNSALAGVAKVFFQKVQSVQNMAAPVVSTMRRSEQCWINPSGALCQHEMAGPSNPLSSPSFHLSLPFLSPPLPLLLLEVGPSNTARGSGGVL